MSDVWSALFETLRANSSLFEAKECIFGSGGVSASLKTFIMGKGL